MGPNLRIDYIPLTGGIQRLHNQRRNPVVFPDDRLATGLDRQPTVPELAQRCEFVAIVWFAKVFAGGCGDKAPSVLIAPRRRGARAMCGRTGACAGGIRRMRAVSLLAPAVLAFFGQLIALLVVKLLFPVGDFKAPATL